MSLVMTAELRRPASLPKYLRPRREKVFGDGRPLPLDREAKIRIVTRARALTHKTDKGKHYGAITAKYLRVLEVLLWTFHNAKKGYCFPSQATIAKAAKCTPSTVALAIVALEAAGLLTWVNRLKRVYERIPDMLGQWGRRVRVHRTSNGYRFLDPQPTKRPDVTLFSSKSENPAGTTIQGFSSSTTAPKPLVFDPDNPADMQLKAIYDRVQAREKRSAP